MATSHCEETRTKLSSKATPFTHCEETRTKLSSKSTPFRPIAPNVGSASTLLLSAGSQDLPADTSTPQFMVAVLLPTTPAYGWSSSTPFAAEGLSQGLSQGPISISDGLSQGLSEGGKGNFKLGDFKSRLLGRAHTQASKEPPCKRLDPVTSFENSWSDDAWLRHSLLVDSFAASCNSTGKGYPPESMAASERRKAMCQCVQGPQSSELQEPRESKGATPVLQHAMTFNEGMQAKEETRDPAALPLPVRHTFIHFSDLDGPKDARVHWSSAPDILMTCEHRTKYPEMEAAHIRKECKPCFYMTKKSDGCRNGGNCEFCHLCPAGSVQKKRKERVSKLREEELIQKHLNRRRGQESGPPCCVEVGSQSSTSSSRSRTWS